ncbi:MAG TPA: S8 family serine peptidase [Gaiellaceae bacterium]
MVGAAFLAALAFAQPVTVAVVDTGANIRAPVIAAKHPVTYDVRTHSRDVADSNGHGTQVASIIARDSGSARLLVIRAGSSSGAFTDANEATGIRYAVDHGAHIINLSLGGPRTSAVERAAVRYAAAHGVLVIAAAGDDYANRPEYPAALLGTGGLAVAAVADNGSPALFSNTGPWVSIAALGADGTSFAAPRVAAAAARVWQLNPRLTARQVVQILEQTASGNGTRNDELGFGVVDVARALGAAARG